jgi:hypothetical protein
LHPSPTMRSFIPHILLSLFAITSAHALDKALQLFNTLHSRADALPAPISIAPDQNWDGIDGKWSTFTLRIGTPAHFVRTYVSFAVYQTWVVAPLGCSAAGDYDECVEARGWVYDNTTSSTYTYLGLYSLNVGENLGIKSNGAAGYDTVGLGGEGEGGPTLLNTTVTQFADYRFYLGYLGINPKGTNWTTFDNPAPSYMTLLKQQRKIPSVSFGFTAGAHYRFTGTFASLTLGGYDTAKYDANNVTFIFAPDNERDVMVAIQSISTPSRVDSNPVATELLPNKVYALIDSTVAELWLPLEACQAFEYEFGLTYDNYTGLYLVNDTQHEILVERNASITLQMGQGPDSNDTVKITLPYAAFDLQATPPYQQIANKSYYFPIRRASDAQVTLGRAFLQEAYIIVDYEVSRFQVAQVVWDQTADQRLVAIPPANASTDASIWTSPNWDQGSAARAPGSGNSTATGNSNSSSSGLSVGAIAGTAVGAVAALAIVGFGFFYRRRQKRKRAAAAAAVAANSIESKPASSSGSTNSQTNGATVYPKAELAGSSPFPFGLTHHDLDNKGLLPPGMPHTPTGTGTSSGYSPTSPSAGEGTYSSNTTALSPASEADSKQLHIYEMPGDMPVVREKDGKQLSEKEALQHREKLYNGVDTVVTPTTPAHPDYASAGAQDPETPLQPRRVNPEDIVDARTGEAISGRHRAFSFEGERGTHDSQ